MIFGSETVFFSFIQFFFSWPCHDGLRWQKRRALVIQFSIHCLLIGPSVDFFCLYFQKRSLFLTLSFLLFLISPFFISPIFFVLSSLFNFFLKKVDKNIKSAIMRPFNMKRLDLMGLGDGFHSFFLKKSPKYIT